MYQSGTRRNGTGVNLGVIYRGVIAKGVNAPGHIYQGVIVPGLMSYIPLHHEFVHVYGFCSVNTQFVINAATSITGHRGVCTRVFTGSYLNIKLLYRRLA